MANRRVTSYKKQILQEIQHTAAAVGAEAADIIPENNYWVLSFLTLILPTLSSEVAKAVTPITPTAGAVWNYLDAGCSVLTGIKQLSDNETHRPVVTKAKGAINIGSGAQLVALTAVNFTLLGGPGFAAAFGAGFLLSLDETTRAIRKKYYLDYWFQDSLAELEKMEGLIQKLVVEIESFNEKLNEYAERNHFSKIGNWALNQKEFRLAELKSKKKEIEEDLLFRSAALVATIEENKENLQKLNPRELKYTKLQEETKALEKSQEMLQQKIQQSNTHFKNNRFMQKFSAVTHCKNKMELKQQDQPDITSHLHRQITHAIEPEEREKHLKKINKKCDAHIKSAIKDSFLWGIAFAGMLAACIPGGQIPGLVLVGVASALYLAKNSKRIYAAGKRMLNYFKSSKNSKNKNDSEFSSISGSEYYTPLLEEIPLEVGQRNKEMKR